MYFPVDDDEGKFNSSFTGRLDFLYWLILIVIIGPILLGL